MKTQSQHRFAGASVLSSKLTMVASQSSKIQNKISTSITVCNENSPKITQRKNSYVVTSMLKNYLLGETSTSTIMSTPTPATTTGITSTPTIASSSSKFMKTNLLYFCLSRASFNQTNLAFKLEQADDKWIPSVPPCFTTKFSVATELEKENIAN